MPFLKTIKSYYAKDFIDFDCDELNLFSFHPQLRIVLAINGIFFNNSDSKLRFIWPVFNVLVSLTATGFQIMFVIHGLEWKDYAFATECFCYLMVLGTVPLVYISLLYNRKQIVELIDNINQDFVFVCGLDAKYRERFLKGQLLIWQMCVLWMAFSFGTAMMFIANMALLLLYQSLFSTMDEHQIRPLVFPMWLPHDDPYRSPNYEIFLVLEIIICFIIVQTFCAYVYTQFHFLLHFYVMMDMIILDLGVLYEGLDESVVPLQKDTEERLHVQKTINSRFRRIVTWHLAVFDSVRQVTTVYGPPLCYQTFISSFGICIIAYQVADSLDHGKFDFLFTMLGVGACVQLWIPCYLGTLIKNKGFEIGDACYNCGWQDTELGRLSRNEIVITIMRAQQPIIIQYVGLPPLTLETFSSIIKTSYSYFNMLRQSTKNLK